MDWHNVRYLDTIPVHFTTVPLKGEIQDTLKWAEETTIGRFGIAEKPDATASGGLSFMRQEMLIGFEDPAEATMYVMFFA
jgi:hypothetical protein